MRNGTETKNMQEKIKVFNIFNAEKGQDSPAGQDIYEWEFFDEQGKVQKDKKNIQEEIQSYISRVDYKQQIQRGEIDLNGNMATINRDYTSLPDNTVDIYKYLTHLATLPKDQVAKLLEQANQASEERIQATQATNQESITSRQTFAQNSGAQPTIGNSFNDTIEGDK